LCIVRKVRVVNVIKYVFKNNKLDVINECVLKNLNNIFYDKFNNSNIKILSIDKEFHLSEIKLYSQLIILYLINIKLNFKF
jgi:hypothetical protein